MMLYGTIVIGAFVRLLGINHELTLDHFASILDFDLAEVCSVPSATRP